MKVLVSDYDKTFYLSDEDIQFNKKLIDIFRKKKQIFIIATGRSYMDFKSEVYKYNILYDYAILNHGATVIDSKDNVIMNFVIDNNISKIISEILKEKTIKNCFGTNLFESRVPLGQKDLTKINVLYNNSSDAQFIFNKIINLYSKFVNLYWISSVSFEIVSSLVGKDKVLALLLDLIKVDKINVYTIGDGYSDIEMIKRYNGYCMRDSVNEVKMVAIAKVDSVSELIEMLLDDVDDNKGD